jgi:tRNA(Ile)-lysidine synthase
MALLAGALFEGRQAGWLVSAVIVDHGLQSASDEVAATVATRARHLGCTDVEVATVTPADAGGPEAAARSARYAALDRAAAARDATVLLGHTRDDQAESVLLGLARGSGTRSLAGMAAHRDRFRRPLLELSRATTTAACSAEEIAVWDDPHNAEPRYARARVRHRVLPVLEAELGPGVAAALARTARLLRDDADALDQWAEQAGHEVAHPDGGLDVGVLAVLPAAVRRRVVRSQLLAAGVPAGDLTADHLFAVDELVTGWSGQQGIDVPGHCRAVRRSGRLTVEPRPVGG